jgi:threonine dehydratase
MSGGHAPGAVGERIFRIDFPERPGALAQFLRSMNPAWNITLFHYRNHGSDVGRVLVAVQVPPCDDEHFTEFLRKIANSGYSWQEETQNVAYKLFLGLNQARQN